MKRGIFMTLMLLPILGVLGETNHEGTAECSSSVIAESVMEVGALNMANGPYVTKIKKTSPSSSTYSKKPKTYLKWDWLTWDSSNRKFVTLMVGLSVFQHERIFNYVPNTHIFGLKFSPAIGVGFGYRFNPYWTFRAKYMNTTAFYATGAKKMETGTFSVNSVSFHAGYDIIKAISPYNDGKHTLSPYVGLGGIIPNTFIKSPITTNFGLSYSCHYNSNISLIIDAEMLMLYGVQNKIPSYPSPFNFHGSIMAGVSYRF